MADPPLPAAALLAGPAAAPPAEAPPPVAAPAAPPPAGAAAAALAAEVDKGVCVYVCNCVCSRCFQATGETTKRCLFFVNPEVAPLAGTVKRKHVHFTQVRTLNADHRQPNTFSRQEFWEHIKLCYEEAYPVEGGAGSILSFGVVVKERHAASADGGLREEHHHCPVFCTQQHYWSKVARISLRKGVPLNAVAHDGYVQMFEYVRKPSARKPLSELDAEPYLSPLHPRDEDLAVLLAAGRHAAAGPTGRRQGQDGGKRERAPALFEVVRAEKVRGADGLREFAAKEAAAGRTALAELCTRQGHKLDEAVSNAWAVLDAPKRALEAKLTLIDKLQRAAVELPCACDGVWRAGATRILVANGIEPARFAQAVMRALRLGARRGCNVACVGAGGCGKSALVEPLEQVFKTASKPQAGSTFPLASALQCDVVLWQDFAHHEATLRFTDLLAFVVGEGLDVRLPGRNVKHHNKAPVFFTGRTAVRCKVTDPDAAFELNKMMDERFTTFHFTEPLPLQARRADWVHCGRCAASFYFLLDL